MWIVYCKVCGEKTGLEVSKEAVLKGLEYYCQCGYSGFADLGRVEQK